MFYRYIFISAYFKLNKMSKCPYCGRVLREHERYCDFCEQDLTEAIGEKLKMKKKK